MQRQTLTTTATTRRCLAVLFELVDQNGRRRHLVAWTDDDGHSKHLKPAHPDKTLRDVSAGDVVICGTLTPV